MSLVESAKDDHAPLLLAARPVPVGRRRVASPRRGAHHRLRIIRRRRGSRTLPLAAKTYPSHVVLHPQAATRASATTAGATDLELPHVGEEVARRVGSRGGAHVKLGSGRRACHVVASLLAGAVIRRWRRRRGRRRRGTPAKEQDRRRARRVRARARLAIRRRHGGRRHSHQRMIGARRGLGASVGTAQMPRGGGSPGRDRGAP